MASVVNANARIFEALSSGKYSDIELALYRKNYNLAAGWSVALAILIAFFLIKFAVSLRKPEIELQYLWFALAPGILLFSTYTSSKVWRAVVTTREKILSIIRDS